MELLSTVRVRRVLRRVAVASLLNTAAIASASAETPPTIDDVMPMRVGELLASAVHTSHLPGAVIAVGVPLMIAAGIATYFNSRASISRSTVSMK